MSIPPGWTQWPPHSGQPPPAPPPSSSDTGPHLNGNVYLMLGELTGGMRWLIWDAHRKTEQIDAIKDQLSDGRSMFHCHDARIAKMEDQAKATREDVPKWERTIKLWASWLIPLGVFAGTGQLAAALQWAKLLR